MQEGVELVVAVAQSRGDGIYTVTPVQRIGVIQSKWPWRRFILCRKKKFKAYWNAEVMHGTAKVLLKISNIKGP